WMGEWPKARQGRSPARNRAGDVRDVRRQVREHVQAGLQTVSRLRLQDRVRGVGEVVDVVDQHVTVLVDELPGGGQQLVEVSQRVRDFVVGVGELVGEAGRGGVQRNDLWVVLTRP